MRGVADEVHGHDGFEGEGFGVEEEGEEEGEGGEGGDY